MLNPLAKEAEMKRTKLLTIVSLVFALASGCSMLRNSGNTASNVAGGSPPAGSSPGTTDAAAPTGDAREDLARSSKKLLTLPKFSADMEATGKTPLHMKYEYVSPDRFHVAYLDAAGQPANEMTLIGQDVYMKTSGRWQKFPHNAAARTFDPREYFGDEGVKFLTDVNYAGEETVNGKPAYAYTYRNLAKEGGSPFTGKVWIGAQDGLPEKINAVFERGELKDLTINYDYTADVHIEPPAVK
jgi:hypothetical protein